MEKELQKLTEQTIVDPATGPFRKWFMDQLNKARQLPAKAIAYIKENIAGLFKPKETSIRDYIRLGRYYVAKRMLILISLLLLVVVYLLFINPPEALNRFLNRPLIIYEKPTEVITATGLAKIYNPQGTLIYVGELLEGVYHGNGKLYRADGSLQYQGSFENGVYSGQGTEFDSQSNKQFQGVYQNGKLEGPGQAFFPTGKLLYEGEFHNGLYSGTGTEYATNGSIVYDGQYNNGFYAGEGNLYFENGRIRYKGSFMDGQYNGEGALFNPAGNLVYEGSFKNGEFSGNGVYYDATGSPVYKGLFLRGAYSGQGELSTPLGQLVYKGDFLKGVYHGQGTLFTESGGVQYEGEFKNGVFEGVGSLFDEHEELIYKGYFKSGQIDVPAFIGKSKSKIQAILGDADEQPETADAAKAENSDEQDLKAPPPLPEMAESMMYKEKLIGFLLSSGQGGSGKLLVEAVQLFHPNVMGMIQTEKLDSTYKSKDLPNQTRTQNADGSYTISYLLDGYIYSFSFYPNQEKPYMLEIRALLDQQE